MPTTIVVPFVSSDDSYIETNNSGTIFSNSTNAIRIGTLGTNPAAPHNLSSGIILRNLAIPQGSVIASATIKLRVIAQYVTGGAENPIPVIEVEDTDNASDPTTAEEYQAKTLTASQSYASVIPRTGTITGTAYTFDITNQIQTIINRPGWQSGNNIYLVISSTEQFSLTRNRAMNFNSLEAGVAGNRPEVIITLPARFTATGSSTLTTTRTQSAQGQMSSASTAGFEGTGTAENNPQESYGEARVTGRYGGSVEETISTSYTDSSAGSTTKPRATIGWGSLGNPAQENISIASITSSVYEGQGDSSLDFQEDEGVGEISESIFSGTGSITTPSQVDSGAGSIAKGSGFSGAIRTFNPRQLVEGRAVSASLLLVQDFTVFRKGNYLYVTLKANKELMQENVNGSYFWNYYGQPIGLSLFHVQTGIRYNLQLIELPEATPELSSDVFRGAYPIKNMLDGTYEIQGHVKALSDKTTVISQSGAYTMQEGDVVQQVGFTLLGGRAIDYSDVGMFNKTDVYSLIKGSPELSLIRETDDIDVVNQTIRYGIAET